jgi:mannosyl-3-phosphoglycerate phosphatase family protein
MVPHRPDLYIVTDLDGSLLDAGTYSAAAAAPVLHRLRRQGIPVVPCSSKTRAEIEILMSRLRLDGPFIVENGGAVYLRERSGGEAAAAEPGEPPLTRIALGQPYDAVVDALRAAASAAGVTTRGFADMSVADVAADCGLPPLDAQLAKIREFDEPFRIVDGDAHARRRLFRGLHRSGCIVLQGGRYHHVVGGTEKGAAVDVLRRFVTRTRPAIFVGLGDAANDLSLLRVVDVPVIIRQADGAHTRWLETRVPSAYISTEPGPTGWAEAVSRVLEAWETGRLDTARRR